MILPTKHISQDRALLTVGARLLSNLTQPQTVSALWEKSSSLSKTKGDKNLALRYDTYVLTLDLLFLLGAIELQDGLLNRRAP
jgi:hypothetical protein